MPVFMTERIARSIYKRPQEQPASTHHRKTIPAITYGPEYWEGRNQIFYDRANYLIKLGVMPGHSLLVVGCGYGALMEPLTSIGVDVWGIDPSPWCWDNMVRFQPNMHLRERIANDWVGSETARTSLARIGAPTRFDWIVDEDAAPSHSDEEIPLFISSLDMLQASDRGGSRQVVHFVSVLNPVVGPGDSSQNWKEFHRWRSTAPHHEWFGYGDHH